MKGGAYYVKSKKKRKTRKNIHGGGQAYYVVKRNDDVIATGHAYSRILPSDVGWFEPHEYHEPDEILNKKIKNELSKWTLNPKTLLSIVLKDARKQEYSEDLINELVNPEKWEIDEPHMVPSHFIQSITNGNYTIYHKRKLYN